MRIEQFPDPYLDVPWQDLGARVLTSGSRVAVTLGYPAAGMRQRLAAQLAGFLGVEQVDLDLGFRAPEGRGPGRIKHVVAVASGKGGVGKSTTAVNLALALDREGARVGLLDADIYGPSQGMMLGVSEGRRPEVQEVKGEKYFVPIKAHGLQAMSMSFLVTEKTPMVWRGPMVSGALQQLLGQTLWDELDYLIVDMPPGTGDIQLTLSQRVPVAGAVIVTTPQDIALIDARKGIEMFRKVDIPVLGIVENMSTFRCPECGHEAEIFGAGGGERIAAEFATPLLGRLPLTMEIREQADGGTPTVARDPDGPIAGLYRDAARHLAAELWRLSSPGADSGAIEISMTDD
jgi:ATP-binding protein involved in chromosome partitioning